MNNLQKKEDGCTPHFYWKSAGALGLALWGLSGIAQAQTTVTWQRIASEGQTFTVSGTQTVRYGAGTSWIQRTVTSSGQCTNAFFGQDPIQGTVKTCEVSASAPTQTTWQRIASEGQTFTVSGTQTVRYGAGTSWIERTMTGSGQCTNAFFGRDPIQGTSKTCEVSTSAPTQTTWQRIASEGQTFTVSGTQTVRYGAGTSWIERTMTGSGQCTNAFFGRDPIQGTAKTCEVSTQPPPQASAYTLTVTKTGPGTVTSPAGINCGTLCSVTLSAGTTVTLTAQTAQGQMFNNWTGCDSTSGTSCTVTMNAPRNPVANYMDHRYLPYVDLSKIPPPQPGFSTRRIAMIPYPLGPSAPGSGDFRIQCGYSHMGFNDPIALPGQSGMSHLHMFFGNTSTDFSSTPESLMQAGRSTTCRGGTANLSAYWVPAMIDTRTGTPLVPSFVMVYYKSALIDRYDIKPMPPGLRMIAGNHKNAAYVPYQYHLRYTCGDRNHPSQYPDNRYPQSIPPDCAAVDPSNPDEQANTLELQVGFPECWNGRDLDSTDHISHMAYQQNGFCPANYVAIPHITLVVRYRTAEAGATKYWRLSSDAYDSSIPGGFSLHGDWVNGWDQTVAQKFVTECLEASKNCTNGELGGPISSTPIPREVMY